MISTDPPKHTKLRSIVNRGFTPRMVAKAEDSVRRRAREIVDAIAPRAGWSSCPRCPRRCRSRSSATWSGVPEADRPRVLDLTNRLLAGGDPEYGGTKESLAQARSRAARLRPLARQEPPGAPAGRHRDDARPRRARRRGATAGGSRAVHPAAAHRGRQRDDAERDQPRALGAHPVPGREAAMAARSRGPRDHRGRGDRPVGQPGHAHAPDAHA